jgi:HAMP domain-containing protein
MTVAVRCEECGKIYHISPSKLSNLKGGVIRGRCTCSHVISFSVPQEAPAAADDLAAIEEIFPEEVAGQAPETPEAFAPEQPAWTAEDGAAQPEAPDAALGPAAEEGGSGADADASAGGASTAGAVRMGIRSKMVLLFLVVPLLIIAAAGLFAQFQIDKLAALITQESVSSIAKMGEDIIADSGRSVAKQCRLYLTAHPTLKKEEFKLDMDFRRLAVQKVGLTGYTFLYQIPDGGAPLSIWVYPDDRQIGKPFSEVMRKELGGEYERLAAIIKTVEAGKNVESSGYYGWKDRDGSLREKFLVVTPLEGTTFGIASTTFLDEFTVPAKRLERRVQQLQLQTRNLGIGILAGTLLIVGLIVSFYGHRLTRNIRKLTDIADRISVGELDAAIPAMARDEVGLLAEAISRMQDSLRLSIERLRRRR